MQIHGDAAHTASSHEITATVLKVISGTRDPRSREILEALVRHAHDFVREVNLQSDELLFAIDFLERCGDISDAARKELILLSDVLGITMVVDTLASGAPEGALEPSVLGPFYRAGAPAESNGANISRGGESDGETAHVFGRVTDPDGRPIAGAELDVWGTNQYGMYENVDPGQPDFNLRGRFRADDEGHYDFWTVKPVSYPIPTDGPVGELLTVANRSHMRPGHLHMIVSAEGFRTVITEFYNDDDVYLDEDPVFGVRDSLKAHYEWTTDAGKVSAAPRQLPHWELQRDLILTPSTRSSVRFSADPERDHNNRTSVGD